MPVLLTGALLPILDFNVVNLALPAIRQNLGFMAGVLAGGNDFHAWVQSPRGNALPMALANRLRPEILPSN